MLRRKDLRTVTVYPLAELPVIDADAAGPVYDLTQGVAIEATVQPMSGAVAAAMWGREVSARRLMLCPTSPVILPGQGVQLDADVPEWQVESVQAWRAHQRVVLLLIPPTERMSV